MTAVPSCRRLKDHEVLIEDSKIDNSLQIIAEGALSVTRDLCKGDLATTHVLRTGDLAGELGFVSGLPHSATLRSLGQTQICILERERFETLLETEPHLVYQVMRNSGQPTTSSGA